MPQYLVTSILFDGSLALEWAEGALAESHDRQQLEKLLLDVSKTGRAGEAGKWLLTLSLSDGSIQLLAVGSSLNLLAVGSSRGVKSQ